MGAFQSTLPVDGLSIGIDEKLVGIEAEALFGLPGAVDAEAVELAWLDIANEAMPDEGGTLPKSDAVGLVAGLVEEADGYAGRVLRIDGKVGALRCGHGAERVWLAGKKGPFHAFCIFEFLAIAW